MSNHHIAKLTEAQTKYNVGPGADLNALAAKIDSGELTYWEARAQLLEGAGGGNWNTPTSTFGELLHPDVYGVVASPTAVGNTIGNYNSLAGLSDFTISTLPPHLQAAALAAREAAGLGGGGAGGGGGGGSGSGTDFRSEAAALFPWLTGQLLDRFAEFWADSGSSVAALGKLRNTSEYDAVFAGIKRSDGTMRLDENAYFSTKAGYREALAEYGKNPSQYESQFVKAIENEMGADELMRGMADAYGRFFEPGGTGDGGLFDAFLTTFVNSGSAVTALQEVRQSSAYDNVFAGNRRDDGTLRMDEPEWFAYKRGWSRTLAGFGLNPEEFMARDRLRESVEGEVSIQELTQRLQVTQDGILDNIEAIRNFYGQNYGIETSAEAILGMAIDPDIQRDVLERRITAAQIGGEASVQGFLRTVERAEQLARMGISQSQARETYGTAARRLPGLGATTQRFNLGASTLTNYEDAVLGQDAVQTGRFERALQREQSSFSSTSDMRRSQDGLGLAGLRQR